MSDIMIKHSAAKRARVKRDKVIGKKSQEILELKNKLKRISKYVEPHLEKGEMWSVAIYAEIHGIDFRESLEHFKLSK